MSDDPRAVQRKCVINEVIQTELTFNTNLKNCFQIILNPLHGAITSRQVLLTDQTLFPLFQKLRIILDISSALYEKLTKYSANPEQVSIASVFSDFPKLVENYFDYIKAFHQLTPILRKTRKKVRSFDDFLKAKEEEQKDTLESILIQPIQRPMRYRLLLQELIKCTPEDAPEMPCLKATLEDLCKVIAEIDAKIEHFEELVEMVQLQKVVSDFQVFKAHRRLLFHGCVMKFSRKTKDERYLILCSDVLLVLCRKFTEKWSVNKMYRSGDYNIKTVDDNPPFENCVDVRQQKKSFRISLKSAQEKRAILEAFDKMKGINKIDQHALEMKGFAPVWIPDELAQRCMSCHAKFNVINRRHHCRYCGDCICGKCFENKIVCPGLGSEVQRVCPKCYKLIKELRAAQLKEGPKIHPVFQKHRQPASEFKAEMEARDPPKRRMTLDSKIPDSIFSEAPSNLEPPRSQTAATTSVIPEPQSPLAPAPASSAPTSPAPEPTPSTPPAPTESALPASAPGVTQTGPNLFGEAPPNPFYGPNLFGEATSMEPKKDQYQDEECYNPFD